MTRHLPSRPGALLTGAAALAIGLSTLAGLPAAAEDPPPAAYAAGLNNPRLISTGPDGALYVAEAGTGGDGPCGPGPEGEPACLGATGSVARVTAGAVDRVLTGLPSIAGPQGENPIGPQDVQLQPGGNFAVSMGAGIEAEARDGTFHAPLLGTVYSGRFDHRGNPTRTRVTDLVAFEAAHNPDGSELHDSDPSGMLATGGSYVVADAGGNTLLHATRGGQVKVLAVFPDRPVDFPFPGFPMQAVPTSVAIGPDGAYYVSQLTGFPFPTAGANIYRVVPGQAPTVWASGLTNVTDLAWDGDRLYAVQLSNVGHTNETGLPMGSLVAVHRGANDAAAQMVGGPLPMPYGVAIRGGDAYVTACTACGAGAGFVAQVPLN
jgi:hypothetical protein